MASKLLLVPLCDVESTVESATRRWREVTPDIRRLSGGQPPAAAEQFAVVVAFGGRPHSAMRRSPFHLRHSV